MAGEKYYGFGFSPLESEHHFLVCIPRGENESVTIYERFKWQTHKDFKLNSSNPSGMPEQVIQDYLDKPKVGISKHKWNLIEKALVKEFNARLKKNKKKTGKWKPGQVPVERLFGKEMVLLAWSIESCDPSVIPTAIKNWLGLLPEERWWLFTMTNASTGDISDKRGWRKAIRFALTENPVEERQKQENLFEFMFRKELEKEK